MPLVPGPRTRRDSRLFRAVLLSEDGKRQTPLGVAFGMDGLKDTIERNSRIKDNKGRILVERAELPDDLEWQVVRRA